jgi:RNA polymerase subunit RPABC4/transcription elongation factor Spt4
MVHCQNCGNINNYGSNFCRFCGAKIIVPPPTAHSAPPPPQYFQPQSQPHQPQSYENNPPRPYSWKTDEFQPTTNAKARKTQQEIRGVQPLDNFLQPPPPAQPPATVYQQPFQTGMAYGYRCPRCGSQNLPIITRKISTAGWIVFAVLLIFTFFFFWIGLLMKEDVRVCPACGLRVG